MARFLALAASPPRWPARIAPLEAMRGGGVLACALALIAAGNALPI